MEGLTALGIEIQVLDIQSDTSIKACAERIPRLDILINNAGALYTMPIADMTIAAAKQLFDLNFWGQMAVTQAFLPLLLKSSSAMIVNQTSVGVHGAIPFQSVYNASKAAMSMFSDVERLELAAFNITVVNLKTGGVNTNIVGTVAASSPTLPEKSIYSAARPLLESALRAEWVGNGVSAEKWAQKVVNDLLKPHPPPVIWRGTSAKIARCASILPFGWLDGIMKKTLGLDKVEAVLRRQ